MTMTLFAVSVACWNARAADQFTPVLVRPLTPITAPVLGTDGKYHAADWGQGLFAQPSPRQSQFPLDLTIINFSP